MTASASAFHPFVLHPSACPTLPLVRGHLILGCGFMPCSVLAVAASELVMECHISRHDANQGPFMERIGHGEGLGSLGGPEDTQAGFLFRQI